MRLIGLAAVVLVAAACGSTGGVPTAGPVSSNGMQVAPATGATTDVNATACTRFDISPCTPAHFRLCGPGGTGVTTSACNGGPHQVHDLAPPGPRPGRAACALAASGLSAVVQQYRGGRSAAIHSCANLGAQLEGVRWTPGPTRSSLGFVCAFYAPEGESGVEIRASAARAPQAATFCSTLASAGWTAPKA